MVIDASTRFTQKAKPEVKPELAEGEVDNDLIAERLTEMLSMVANGEV